MHLAHSVGAHVIAEGVETVDQQQVLARAGVDSACGYLLARPRPAAQVVFTPASPMPADPETTP